MVESVVLSFKLRAEKYLFNRSFSGFDEQLQKKHKTRMTARKERVFLSILPPS
jgi:hypothetical protein